MPGIKPGRADIILGGALVVQAVLEAGGFDAIDVTEAGLREGVFFERYLARDNGGEALFDDVRRASVVNLAAQYGMAPDRNPHVAHVARLALGLFDELAAAGVHPGDSTERELLWAGALLHDIGMTIDYDDHHKHSRYLVLNAGPAGLLPREVALIGQAVRYHRKGMPSLGPFASIADAGDEDRLHRMSALLRLAEDLERSRDQLVREARVSLDDGGVRVGLVTDERRAGRALGGRPRGRALRARVRARARGGVSRPLRHRRVALARRAGRDLERLGGRRDRLELLDLELGRLHAVADEAERAGAELRVGLQEEAGDRVALLPLHPLDLERVHPHRVRRERAVLVVLGLRLDDGLEVLGLGAHGPKCTPRVRGCSPCSPPPPRSPSPRSRPCP